MAANPIDYDALAQQHGAMANLDFDALAAQHGATNTPAPSLGRDIFGEIPSNPITRIGRRIKENLDLPKQVGRAADAIHAGIQNIKADPVGFGESSKMPEFLDALKQTITQYKDPEKLAADLITGYVTAGAPEIPTPKMGAEMPWWKKTGEVAGPASGLDTAISIGKKLPIPKIKAIAHLADFARKLSQGAEEAPETAPSPAQAPSAATPTGPPTEWGNRIPGEIPQTGQSIREGLTRANTNQPLQALRESTNDLIDQHISPKADPVKNFQTKHNVEVALSQGDVARAEAALKQATAPERRVSTGSYSGPERRAPSELGFLSAKPINPENIGFDWAPPEDLGNKVRPGVEQKLGPIKRSAAPSDVPAPYASTQATGPVPAVQNIRENLAMQRAAEAQGRPGGYASLAEERAIGQEMQWDEEKTRWRFESEARREFIARNSTGVTKGELTGAEKSPAGVSKSAGPVPSGTEIPTEATQMDLLQRSLRAVRAGKTLKELQ